MLLSSVVRHSEELIKKLEQAGLGYHVDADETTDRLGRVPMRRLVSLLDTAVLTLEFKSLNVSFSEYYVSGICFNIFASLIKFN